MISPFREFSLVELMNVDRKSKVRWGPFLGQIHNHVVPIFFNIFSSKKYMWKYQCICIKGNH